MTPYLDIFGWQSHSAILEAVVLLAPVFGGALAGIIIVHLWLRHIGL